MNNELKINVDEQQDDIKHFKEQCDIDNENDVQEITAAITPMTKKPVCVTFVKKKWVKKNIARKSTMSSGEIIVEKCSEIE